MASSLIAEIEKGSKNALLKKHIINSYIYNVTSTIPELAKELSLSIPTVTKLINEMVEEGLLVDHGKIDTKGGRRPCLYGLNPSSGYFLGVDIRNGRLNLALSNFTGDIVARELDRSYSATDSAPEVLDEICSIAADFIRRSGVPRERIFYCCMNISGRVNHHTGYSFSRYNFSEVPLSDVLSQKIGLPVTLNNDTRSMTFGEYLRGVCNGEKNVLYINLSWGLGLGMVLDGKIYEGRSGYAGELGHIHAFENEIICHCGKKGCLETEVSGRALHANLARDVAAGKNTILAEAFKENPASVELSHIVDAINREDLLCIERLEEMGEKLGLQVAHLINIFNPELVIIGGTLSAVNEYILQPVRQTVKKYSLNLMSQDTRIVCAQLGDHAGLLGACLTARTRMLNCQS